MIGGMPIKIHCTCICGILNRLNISSFASIFCYLQVIDDADVLLEEFTTEVSNKAVECDISRSLNDHYEIMTYVYGCPCF